MKNVSRPECRRLPGNETTLRFLSPYLEQPHIRAGADDLLLAPYGIWNLFIGIRLGRERVYGVFGWSEDNERKTPDVFAGFVVGHLDESGTAFENHAFWNRGMSAADCAKLCIPVMKADFAKDGIRVSSVVGYIPDRNRAAKRYASQVGCLDRGLRTDKTFVKDGRVFPCREFRLEL